MIGILLVMIH